MHHNEGPPWRLQTALTACDSLTGAMPLHPALSDARRAATRRDTTKGIQANAQPGTSTRHYSFVMIIEGLRTNVHWLDLPVGWVESVHSDQIR